MAEKEQWDGDSVYFDNSNVTMSSGSVHSRTTGIVYNAKNNLPVMRKEFNAGCGHTGDMDVWRKGGLTF